MTRRDGRVLPWRLSHPGDEFGADHHKTKANGPAHQVREHLADHVSGPAGPVPAEGCDSVCGASTTFQRGADMGQRTRVSRSTDSQTRDSGVKITPWSAGRCVPGPVRPSTTPASASRLAVESMPLPIEGVGMK